tara:strand:- start:1998 stop:2300 length:303 start_codon:yes stop_codon:yes gene_type:complete
MYKKQFTYLGINIEITSKGNFDYYLDPKSFLNLRKTLSMTQINFAKFLGISVRAVQRIEANQHIGLNIMHRLEKPLGKWKFVSSRSYGDCNIAASMTFDT